MFILDISALVWLILMMGLLETLAHFANLMVFNPNRSLHASYTRKTLQLECLTAKSRFIMGLGLIEPSDVDRTSDFR